MTGRFNANSTIRRLDLAFDVPGLSSSEKLLIIVMARFGNSSGFCWASQQTLADKCGCDRSTINRLLKKLKDKELVTPTKDPKRRTVTYRLNCGKWRSLMKQNDTLGVAERHTRQSQIATQNQDMNQKMNHGRRSGKACGQPIGELATKIIQSKEWGRSGE